MVDQTASSASVHYAASLQLLVNEQLASAGPTGARGQSCRIDARLAPVLLFSPHPDDESITGLLPLRLLEEEGRRVIDIALTLGSKEERREARAGELVDAGHILGFEVEHFEQGCTAPERLKSFGKPGEAGEAQLLAAILAILAQHRPALVVHPHRRDGHPTHEGAARMLEQALRLYSRQGNTVVAAETECWQPLPRVDLVVEGSAVQVGRLCSAIACHVGEVRRNPYHVRQPLRMLENGFRVSESVTGFGGKALPAAFYELYALFRYRNGRKSRSRQRIFSPRPPGLTLEGLLAEAF